MAASARPASGCCPTAPAGPPPSRSPSRAAPRTPTAGWPPTKPGPSVPAAGPGGPGAAADSAGPGRLQSQAASPQPVPGTCLPAAGYPGPVHSAAMAAARGRIGSSFGAPVVNPHRGPLAYAPQGPARARLLQLQPRAGWIASNPGAPVRNPVIPAFYPRPAVRAQSPMPRRGTCRAIRSYPPSSRRR